MQQNTIPGGETASPVQERSQPLCRFLLHLIDVSTKWTVYQVSPQDNGRHRLNGLAPRRAELIGVSGCEYRSWWRASRSSSSHWWRSSIHSATALSNWDMSTGIWLAVLADETWLWPPCRLHREPTRRGGKAKAYRLHTDWMGRVKYEVGPKSNENN
jgi:hypothetical protein